MIRRLKPMVIIFLALIVGCASTQPKGDMIAANRVEADVHDSRPVLQPEKPLGQPASLKGQVQKIEKFKPATQTTPKVSLKAVSRANQRAAQRPGRGRFINAITVYDYIEGALFQVYTSPVHITDIMLQPGEELTSPPAAGDTVRWMVGDTVSGSGGDSRVHVFVKPTASGLKTNIILTTTKRTYYLEAKSYKKTYQASVSWNYPQDEFKSMQRRVEMQNESAANVTAAVNLEDVNFGYRVKGSAKWKPTMVFDDGKKTYIRFPESVSVDEMPPLFIVKSDRAQIVNYRYRNNYYIVDRLFEVACLKMGEKNQEQVYIYRN